ncbi:MAG: very short patch repair endonuclease, partial [Pseudomonadales bacterium]
MADRISAPQRSANMAAIKSKNTKPEMVVRRVVRSLEVGYRLHRRDIPGNPDLSFIGRRKAIFVHGCFWHQHEDADCPLTHVPQSRLEYWHDKLARNKARDIINQTKLSHDGWQVLVVWECETRNLSNLTRKISKFLRLADDRGDL